MDPEAALDELLALIDRIQPLSGMHLTSRVLSQDIGRLVELMDGLDGWLTAGGFLPARWRSASR
jgi:hypothetical protein